MEPHACDRKNLPRVSHEKPPGKCVFCVYEAAQFLLDDLIAQSVIAQQIRVAAVRCSCAARRRAGTQLSDCRINPNCEPGHYYHPANTAFTIPPSSPPGIGDDLNAYGISWKYHGDQWNNYVPDPYQLNYGVIWAASRRILQHLQPFPVRHVHHVAPGSGESPHPGCDRLRVVREKDRRPGSELAVLGQHRDLGTISYRSRDNFPNRSLSAGSVHDSGYVRPLDCLRLFDIG